jgi:hypothetical protein
VISFAIFFNLIGDSVWPMARLPSQYNSKKELFWDGEGREKIREKYEFSAFFISGIIEIKKIYN